MRSLWYWVVVQLFAVLIALGTVAVAATQSQRTSFDALTSRMDSSMGALAEIDLAMLDLVEPANGVIYQPDGSVNFRADLARYYEARERVNKAFDRLEASVQPGDEADLTTFARSQWEQMDAGVLGAPAKLESRAVQQAIANRAEDPFASIWGALLQSSGTLTQLRATVTTSLSARSTEVRRSQSKIPPLVLISGLVAVLVAARATRRVARQVLTPLAQLGAAARSLRDASAPQPVHVPGASAELQELATTLNETADSLRADRELLVEQANTDVLTGLPNRKAFTEYAAAALSEHAERPFGVLFVDLDDFKVVNDTLGHAAGDELLRIVAQRLRSSARACDVVARLGGDEFALAVDMGSDPDVAVTIARRILAAFEKRIALNGTEVAVGCSIGIATNVGDDCSPDTLLGHADFSMYMAKSRGKNRFAVFAPSMHADLATTEP